MPAGNSMTQCHICKSLYYTNGYHQCNSIINSLYEEIKPVNSYKSAFKKAIKKEREHISQETSRSTTLIVNFFGGPSSRKSTMAGGVVYELKAKEISCEFATEHAKDIIYNRDRDSLNDQIYIFGNQFHRIHRLLDVYDVIVTDSPILLSPIYDKHNRPTLEKLAIEEHRKMWTYNVFMKRTGTHDPNGRIHNLDESIELDNKILNLLEKYGECYETFEGTHVNKNKIVNKIVNLLQYSKTRKNNAGFN